MRLVVQAVIDRGNQFFATAGLLFVMVWFFSSLAFYYLRSDYVVPEIEDNLCASYVKCLFTYLNEGLFFGGLDNNTIVVDYANQHYASRFFFDWIFFFFINLVLLNVVNAIIVDTFQTYREQQSKRNFSEKNICYICSLSKSRFEINGLDFHKHVTQEHKLENYIYFLIGIRSEDEHKLNSLQYKILKEMTKIQFFPIKRGMIFDEK